VDEILGWIQSEAGSGSAVRSLVIRNQTGIRPADVLAKVRGAISSKSWKQ